MEWIEEKGRAGERKEDITIPSYQPFCYTDEESTAEKKKVETKNETNVATKESHSRWKRIYRGGWMALRVDGAKEYIAFR